MRSSALKKQEFFELVILRKLIFFSELARKPTVKELLHKVKK